MDEFLRELAALDAPVNFAKTMALLRALKSGAVKLDDVTITSNNSWQVSMTVPTAGSDAVTTVEPGGKPSVAGAAV